MEDHGQMSAEFVMIMSIIIMISISISYSAVEAIELNTCMISARNGAIEGCMLDGLAVYPTDKIELYDKSHPRLKSCNRIHFIEMKWYNTGFDTTYQKTKIKIKIYASSSTVMDFKDRACAGDKITYYVRKNICKAFHTENLTNIFYNPAFSDKYCFTTYEVEWI